MATEDLSLLTDDEKSALAAEARYRRGPLYEALLCCANARSRKSFNKISEMTLPRVQPIIPTYWEEIELGDPALRRSSEKSMLW
jgi:hypothetical protein